MDYHALISSSLLLSGVDADRVRQINAGAQIYGESGLLDSLQLVCLIATLGDMVDSTFGKSTDFLHEPDSTLLEEFRDIYTLAAFLEQGLSVSALNPQRSVHG